MALHMNLDSLLHFPYPYSGHDNNITAYDLYEDQSNECCSSQVHHAQRTFQELKFYELITWNFRNKMDYLCRIAYEDFLN